MSRILRSADDIRQWAEARGGQPAWSELPSGTRSQITLRIVFDQYLLNSGEAQDTDRPGGGIDGAWQVVYAQPAM